MIRTTATLLASALLTLVPASAQDTELKKIVLKPKLEPGVYQTEEMIKTTMGAGKQDHTAIKNLTLAVTPQGADGKEKLVSSRVDRVRIETNATTEGQRIAYDSADRKKQSPNLAEMATGLLSIRTAAVYDEDSVFKGFQGTVTDDTTRAMMKQLTDLGFPERPVGPGDKWEHQIEVDMGQMGKVKYDLDYEFTKMVRYDATLCALLKITGKMQTIPGAAANEGFDLKSNSLSGVMYFDPRLGAVRKYEINSKLDLTAFGKKMPASMTMRTVLKKFTKR